MDLDSPKFNWWSNSRWSPQGKNNQRRGRTPPTSSQLEGPKPPYSHQSTYSMLNMYHARMPERRQASNEYREGQLSTQRAQGERYQYDYITQGTTPSQVSGYGTKISGAAVGRAFNGSTGTYAEGGGCAAAVSRNGDAWSKSIAYGGHDSTSSSSSLNQVSTRSVHTYTSGNAEAGVMKGGKFAQAGPGGYAEAAYVDGSKHSVSVAHGGGKTPWWKKDQKTVGYQHSIPVTSQSGGSSGQRQRIENHYPESDDEGEEGHNSDDEWFFY